MDKDLISRAALKTAIEDRIDNIPASEYDEGWNNAIYAVIDEIDNAPTVSKKDLQKIFYETAEKPELKEVIAYECGKASTEREQGEWIETKHRVNLLIGVLYSNQVISKNDLEYIEDSIKKLMKGKKAGEEE